MEFVAFRRRFFSRAEAACPLLIHLGARCTPVNRHVKNLLGTNDVVQMFEVDKNCIKNLALRENNGRIEVLWMRRIVDNAIHIQIKVVKFWNLVSIHSLAEARKAFAVEVQKL